MYGTRSQTNKKNKSPPKKESPFLKLTTDDFGHLEDSDIEEEKEKPKKTPKKLQKSLKLKNTHAKSDRSASLSSSSSEHSVGESKKKSRKTPKKSRKSRKSKVPVPFDLQSFVDNSGPSDTEIEEDELLTQINLSIEHIKNILTDENTIRIANQCVSHISEVFRNHHYYINTWIPSATSGLIRADSLIYNLIYRRNGKEIVIFEVKFVYTQDYYKVSDQNVYQVKQLLDDLYEDCVSGKSCKLPLINSREMTHFYYDDRNNDRYLEKLFRGSRVGTLMYYYVICDQLLKSMPNPILKITLDPISPLWYKFGYRKTNYNLDSSQIERQFHHGDPRNSEPEHTEVAYINLHHYFNNTNFNILRQLEPVVEHTTKWLNDNNDRLTDRLSYL
jgi:hypothetical protein